MNVGSADYLFLYAPAELTGEPKSSLSDIIHEWTHDYLAENMTYILNLSFLLKSGLKYAMQ